jgi:hypothetical protein
VAFCFDGSSPANAVACQYTRSGTGEVVFTWAPAFSGTVIISSLEGGGGGSGSVTAGTGIIVAGDEVSVDTAVIQSRATLQAGTTQYCRSTTGNDTYTCSLTPALTAYTRGGCVVLDADTANTGTATLNVDTIGAQSILNRAGSALANGDITANKPITLCYDGTQFIVQGDGGGGGGGTPGGTDRQVQFNDSSSFGGAANAVYHSDGYLHLLGNAIGTTLTDRLRIGNTTAATSGQDQNTPSIHLIGTGWNAVEARSEVVDYWITGTPYKQGASGPSRPQPGFEIAYAINGGAKGTLFHMHQTRNAYDSDFPQPNYFLGLFAGNQSTMTDAAMANIGIGTYALNKLTGGNENMAFGNSALYECTTCYWNTAVGNEAGIGVTTGYLNTFIGQDAGRGISLVTTTRTGAQNTHLGTQAGPATPNQVSNSVAIGYQASVFGSNQGVLGQTGVKWAVGGFNNPDKTLVVADPTTVGSEVVDPITDTDWDGYTDFSVAGDNCAYAHSAGSGTCKTFTANYNTALKGNRLYRFRFTLSGHAGNPACFLQNMAGSDISIGHTQPPTGVNPNGTWDILFRTAASPGDVTIYCTSDSGDDEATFDDVSVKEILDGDLDVNKDGSFGGNVTSSNIKRGTGTPEGNVVGVVGDIYQRTDGGTDTALYRKESGTGNTGWVAVAAGGGGGVADPGANGIMARTALNTTTARTITGTANRITVTNGDGVSGNPTLDVGSNFGELVAAGTDGIAAFNAGDDTTTARSDHTHRVPMSLQWFFPGAVASGVQVARALVPEDVTNCTITNSRISVGTTGSTSTTWNIQRCTTSAGNCTAASNIYSSSVTLNSSTQSVAGGAPNTATVTAGDAFRVDLVGVGTGLSDVTVNMAYKCETTN